MSVARLVPVFQGTMGEALAARAALDAAGYTTFVEDELTKIIDPFITGGNVLQVTVLANADKAPEILQYLREQRAASLPLDNNVSPEHEETREERIERLEALSLRVRWCIVSFLPPLGIVKGLNYLKECQRTGLRAKKHMQTIVAFWMCVLFTTVFACGIYFICFGR